MPVYPFTFVLEIHLSTITKYGTDVQVMVWNLDCPEAVIKNPVRTISHHTDVVLSMSFNQDGSLLATTCKDKKVRLMDPRSGNLLQASVRVCVCGC